MRRLGLHQNKVRARARFRRHGPQFKLQICQETGSGQLNRREAQRKYDLSAILIRFRMTQSDRGDLAGYEAEASVLAGEANDSARCANELEALQSFCGSCGARLRVASMPPDSESTPTDTSLKCKINRRFAAIRSPTAPSCRKSGPAVPTSRG